MNDTTIPARLRPSFPVLLNPAELATRSPLPREWMIDSLLPARVNALLGAHGGRGKSLLALQMAVAVAAGTSFMGYATTRAPVMFISAEDDADELHRRLFAVCRATAIDMAALEPWLFLFDGVGIDVALFGRRCDTDDSGRPYFLAEPDATLTYGWLMERCARIKPRLLILDALSDVYDADENRRPQVRRFLNLALQLVLPHNGSVLNLAHVDKASARGTTARESYSGSTAWHNGSRVRLELAALDTDEDAGEAAVDRYVLAVRKINYGRPGLELPLHFDAERHVFALDGAGGSGDLVASIRRRTERRAILDCLETAFAAGRSVMVAPRANDNAATMLAPMAGFPAALRSRDGRRRLFALLAELDADGLIHREAFLTPSRHPAERWRLTPAGQRLRAD